jgi:2-C-methyl-D-erythritol 4-phosphate cytidylyltransferase
MGSVAAIVLGAGSGSRVGASASKMYLPIAGEPMLVHTARAFARHPDVDELHVVAAAVELDLCRRTLRDAELPVASVIAGGAARHASEDNALQALAARIESGEVGLVVIHDGARPLVDAATIARTIAAARADGGAIAAVPVRRSLAMVDDGVMTGRLPADEVWRAQTPQAFEAGRLLEAFRRARADGFEGSDTASSLERLGLPVRLVHGDEGNLKVTYPVDLGRAEALLSGVSRA